MSKKQAYNIIPYSTSQENRFNEALSPSYIAIDGKNLEDHLSFIAEYAKYIHFYNTQHKKDGNWHGFFTQANVVFLSTLLQTDIESLNQKKNQLYSRFTNTLIPHTESDVEQLQLFFIDIIDILIGWFTHSKKIQGSFLAYELKNAIKNRLSQEAKNIVSTDSKTTNTPQVQERFHNSFLKWRQSSEDEDSTAPPISQNTLKIVNQPEKIRDACTAFLNTIRYILNQVPEWLTIALEREKSQTPHIGLLLAFLNLYAHVKNQFNDLSKKHLDHFYRTLLQQTEIPQQPDRCVVFFELAKEAVRCFLPKGMRLTAGQSKTGSEIIYRTLADEELYKAKLAEIRTLLVSTNPIIAPLNKANLVTGIYTFQKSITAAELLNEAPYNFYLFGADPFGDGDADTYQKNTVQPQIGWAIAAPILALKEGYRSVSLSIYFDEKSMSALWDTIKKITVGSEFTETEMLYYFFSESFQLSITGKEGWMSIANYAIDFKKSNQDLEYPDTIVFLFTFGKDAPEIAPFDPAVHLSFYKTTFPVLQMALKSNTTYYPYSLLRGLMLEDIAIHVDCSHIKSLELYDAFGKLENNKPFEPFGPAPLKGESFYIGYEELADKKLTALSLDIDWYKLPQEGFEDHYKAYPGNITNSSFTFNVYALSQGEWIPKKEYTQNLHLFQEENGSLSEESNYEIDVSKLYYVPYFKEKKTPFSFENAVNSFLKLELESPPIGFGQEAYLKIMTNNVYTNLNAPNRRRRPEIVIPETPFVPKMRTIRMQYSAEQVIHFNPSKEDRKSNVFPFDFFHLQPFGIEIAAHTKHIKKRRPVAKFNDRGYLFLGFKDTAPNQSLSLYFKVTTNTYDAEEVPSEDILWEYLSGASWKPLPKESILEDQTTWFTEPGIIKIHLPEDINHHHHLFSAADFWLRISTPDAMRISRNCSYINTQAVLVEKDLSTASASFDKPLREKSIVGVYDKNKDVKTVLQPFPSFGGKAPEDIASFYTRISERLFHKNRAVIATDYERLILREFPEIFQVSCLTATLFPGEIKPNEIVIIILRNMNMEDARSHRKFSITTLEKVRDYIAKHSPPYIKITVRNPVYEVIRVSCDIILKDNRSSGEKLKNLQQAINSYIAPWLYRQDPSTYKKHILHARGIENLISKQPYIDFVTHFSLVQFSRQSNTFTYIDTAVGSHISPSQPWSVFVPALSHDIRLVNDRTRKDPSPLQIGGMKIEEDFILQPDEKPAETQPPVAATEEPKSPRRIVLKVKF